MYRKPFFSLGQLSVEQRGGVQLPSFLRVQFSMWQVVARGPSEAIWRRAPGGTENFVGTKFDGFLRTQNQTDFFRESPALHLTSRFLFERALLLTRTLCRTLSPASLDVLVRRRGVLGERLVEGCLARQWSLVLDWRSGRGRHGPRQPKSCRNF